MEGVLVRHQEGWLYDHHNLVGDDEGRFSFRADGLDPGALYAGHPSDRL